MALKVTTEPMEHRQLSMIVEVDEQRFNEELRKAARKVARQYRIPGFRKGRAPLPVIIRHFGVGALVEEFVDDLGSELYAKALEQEGIEPSAPGSLVEIELDPLRYHYVIPLEPKAELGDYRSLRIERPEVTVDDEGVEARIQQLLEEYAEYKEVDRPSQYGDVMTVDVRAVVLDEEGNETDTVVLDETDWEITPDLENPMDPPGFDEAIVGLKPGETKTFTIEWPEDSQSMYAGETVQFTVHVHSISAYETPELTDELAQTIGPEYETAEDLRNSIREELREMREREAEREYLDQIIDALLEMSEIDFPPALVDREIDRLMQNVEQQVRQFGFQSLEHYLEAIQQDLDEFREGYRRQAEENVRVGLLLNAVREAEGIVVTDDEVEERVRDLFGAPAEDADDAEKEAHQAQLELFRDGAGRAVIENDMITPKVIERLIAIASGEEVPPPTPLSAATEEDQAESAAGEMEESESAAEVDENEAELEPIAQGESEQADPE